MLEMTKPIAEMMNKDPADQVDGVVGHATHQREGEG